MTGKLIPRKASTGMKVKDIFPAFPPRDDMQNFLYLYRPAFPASLELHFGLSDSTVLLCEAPVRWAPSQRQGHRIPDLLIAFNVDRASAVEQMGYSIKDQGKPPDFVLEIASPTTGQNDYTDKRADYANFGVPEYWRFDASGGQFHDAPMAGDLLVDGVYRPIEIFRTDESHLWGHSNVLNLDLCWEDGQLRWWDPAAQRYLETHDEVAEGRLAEREGRIAEREGRIAEREGRITEREGRLAAEARAESERESRLQAEARVQEMEEELRRLRSP